MKKLIITAVVLLSGTIAAQENTSEKFDLNNDAVLKGSNTQFRNFWDVKKYEISVETDYEKKSVSGVNVITFEILKDVSNPTFQIDLQKPMSYSIKSSDIKFETQKREGDFIFLGTKRNFKKGEKLNIAIAFSGNPVIGKRLPWDGGWTFTKDKKNNPWISVAQEGIGASVWLPTKDIWSDEPDNGIILKIKTPRDFVGVGNGRLIDKKIEGDSMIYTWEIKNPINAYSIIPNIGKYVNFKDTYNGEKGKLDLDYWVLDYNLDKAKKQFQQTKSMLDAFEYWFGPYPFYEDSFKLVESPYLGMEHQSSVAYGNNFENGYLGRDLSGTGIGLKWDYILVHESGHEWFANNITAKDQADMWIHEGFTSYSEALFSEHYINKKAGQDYVIGLRNNIDNDVPIIGEYGIRKEGSGDMYPKGANLIHTIRTVMNDDEKFRQILRGLNKDFYHQTVTSKQVEDYISEKSGINFSTVFDQYLRTIKIPVLEYSQKGNLLKYRYQEVVKNIDLPLLLNDGTLIKPTVEWQTKKLKNNDAAIFNPNYYVIYKKI